MRTPEAAAGLARAVLGATGTLAGPSGSASAAPDA
jgi:hypothetical protein